MSSTEVAPAAAAGADVEAAFEDDTDAPSRELLAELSAAIGAGAVAGSEVMRGDLWVRVPAGDWKRAVQACRDLGFDYFCFLSGIDWMPSTAPNPRAGVSDSVEGLDDEEDAEPEPDSAGASADGASADGTSGDGWATGYAGGETRFQVFARLYSTTRHRGLTLKADLDDESPTVDSIIEVYPGADWNERETWEMYGFDFAGHPHLVHLYLPGEFEGFPQRKDFPLLSREVKPWPGLVDVEPMPESPEAEAETAAAAEAAPVTAAAGGTTVTETADDAPASDLPPGTVAVGDAAVAESNVRERVDPEPPTVFPAQHTPEAEPPATEDAAPGEGETSGEGTS